MSKNIEKSSIILQKEQQLSGLFKIKKKIITQLKRNKTTLEKLKEEVIKLQQNIRGRMMGSMMETLDLKTEITHLLKAILKSEKIEDSEKEGLNEVIAFFEESDHEIEEMMGMGQEEFEKQRGQAGFNTDEFNRQRAQGIFDQFTVKVEEGEQKLLRKTYVKLATRFHPDKAQSAREKEQFHRLMQQIISAYERGDVEELLSLETKYADKQTLAEIDIDHEGAIVDFLDTGIDKIEREIDMLKKQLERVKKEVKNIHRSEMGSMIKMQKDARKYGYNTIEDEINEMDEQLKGMREVRDGLKEYLDTGVMPEIIEQAFMQSHLDYDEDDLEIELDEFIGLFGNIIEDEDENPPPKRRRRRKK